MSLHDISMAFHDAAALPVPSLPRPSSPLQTFITHLVLAHDLRPAAAHLSLLALKDPTCIPLIALALRKRHFPRRPALPTPHAPALLRALVRTIPFFYRYLAAPPFARGLRRLACSASPAAPATRLLLAAWARDLAPLASAHDPAAMLWVATYRRARRDSPAPFPRPPPVRFVCPVALPRHPRPATDAPLDTPGHRMPPGDVAATLRLLEQVVLAANRSERPNPEPRQTSSSRRRRPPRPPGSSASAVWVNEKLLSVLRRNDLFAAEDLMGLDDSAITLRAPSDKGGESSGALSVAKLAKINARRKLDESYGSLSVSWVGRSEVDTFDRLEMGLGSEHEEAAEAEDATVEKAFTPSTFADIGIEQEDLAQELLHAQQSGATGESVGDTIKLDGLELGSADEKTSLGQKILRFMAAMAKGESGSAAQASSSRHARSRDGDSVNVGSVGRVC